MDIQWVILARAYRLNKDRTLDIWRIINQITIYGENNRASLHLAKEGNNA